jgi:protein-disulfide isomerase
MSNRTPSQTPARGDRREALRQQQQAAARTGRTVKTAWITGLALIVVMLVTVVWTIAQSGRGAGPATGSLVAPAGAAGGSLVVGDPNAKVTVTIYADFMCPYCGQFERANASALDAAVAAGKAKLDVHPMAFLDDNSAGTRYSTRAANAFVTVANADPAAAMAFYRLLFEQQPAERTPGLSDDQLVSLARQAGAPEAVTATFAARTYVPWVEQVTQQAWRDGVKGTPTVKLNGQVFGGDLYTAGPLAEAIDQAAGA